MKNDKNLFDLELVRKYVGITDAKIPNDIHQERLIKHFTSKIKIGNLYIITDRILGSKHKPFAKKFSNNKSGVCWELSVEDMIKKYGFSFEEAKKEVKFSEFVQNSIVLPVKFEENGHLLQMLCDGNVFWFSTEYLSDNTTLVPIDNAKIKETINLLQKHNIKE